MGAPSLKEVQKTEAKRLENQGVAGTSLLPPQVQNPSWRGLEGYAQKAISDAGCSLQIEMPEKTTRDQHGPELTTDTPEPGERPEDPEPQGEGGILDHEWSDGMLTPPRFLAPNVRFDV